MLDGLRGRLTTIAEGHNREDSAESLYYQQLVEGVPGSRRAQAGSRIQHEQRPAARSRTQRREAQALKEVVAEQALELRLLKKRRDRPDGDGEE